MVIVMKESKCTKKVAFIFNYSKSDYKGGIASILDCFCNNENLFIDKGYSVAWVNLQKKYSNNKLINLFQKIFRLLFEKYTLLKVIKKGNFDIVHFHSSRGFTLFKDLISAKHIKKKLDLPIVFTIHFAEINNILVRNKLLKKMELSIFKKQVDKVICLSTSTSNEFEKMIGNRKTKVIYTFHSYEVDDYNKVLKQYNKSRLSFLFMGSIDERKGIFDLIKVFKNYDLNANLNICGGFGNDSGVKTSFFNMIEQQSNINYRGYVIGLEKEEILQESDVLVLPSFAEGMPVVIMEAMAKGCAIVATDVGAIPEIVTSENGILIKPGNDEELFFALNKLNNDRELLQKMKLSNLKKSYDYSLKKHIEELVNVYEESIYDK